MILSKLAGMNLKTLWELSETGLLIKPFYRLPGGRFGFIDSD